MRIRSKRPAAAVAALTLAALFAPAALAQSGHEHMQHEHMHMGHGAASAPAEVPPLKILMPRDGDTVGSRLAIVFETPADLVKMTMGHQMAGTHLHVEAGDTALMPSQEQLIRLGQNRYLFLFDLPVQAGRRELRVSWADANHETIASSVQKVTVTVVPEGAASQ